MNWVDTRWLALVPAVGLLGIVLALWALGARRRLTRVLSPQLVATVLPASVRRRRTVRMLLALTGVALALVALAEPRFDKQIRTVKASGSNIVVLLDLSRSMDATDVDPSRLGRARRELRDLGRLLSGDRVGLVVFAGGAYPRLPLTQDFAAVELVMSETSTETFQAQGSNLAEAMRVGQALLSRADDQAGQAMLVLSDGETHDPDEARAVADELARDGVPVYAMGIGIEPSAIPMPDGARLQHAGTDAISTPDFGILEEVARRTGGAFVKSNAADRDMKGLYDDLRRNVRAVERGAQQRETWRSAFQVPLGLGLLALLLGAWLGDGRRRWGAAAAVLLAVQLLPGVAHAQDPLMQADRMYRDGRYAEAAEQLTELSLQTPDDAALFERLGAARYRAGDWGGSARAYDHAAALSGDPEALYSAGNAHYRAGRLEDAHERYESVLADEAEHEAAAHNRDLVLAEMEARRQQQPPPPPPQQGDDNPEDGEGEGDENEESGGGQGQAGGEPQKQDPGEQEPSGDQEGTSDEEVQGSEGSPTTDPSDPAGSPGESSDAELEDPGTNEAVSPDELGDGGAPEGEPTPAESGDGTMGEDDGPITSGQAERLLDAIEEGSQRVKISGKTGSKPW